MVFAKALIFLSSNQDCNIPEAILPEPFSGSSITAKPYSLPVNLSSPLDTEILESSHLSPSLSSHFSQKAVVPKEKKTQLLVSSIPCSFVDDGPIQATESEMAPPRSCPKSPIVTDSVQQTQLLPAGSSKTCENTPLKLTSENNNLLLETPAQSTPRRSLSATEDKHKKVISQSALASNLTVKRSLMDDLDWSETVDSIFPQMDIKGTSASGSVTTSAIHLSEVLFITILFSSGFYGVDWLFLRFEPEVTYYLALTLLFSLLAHGNLIWGITCLDFLEVLF